MTPDVERAAPHNLPRAWRIARIRDFWKMAAREPLSSFQLSVVSVQFKENGKRSEIGGLALRTED